MSMSASSTRRAVAANNTSYAYPIGGVSPYEYFVLPNGAGGSIDDEGLYTAPVVAQSDPTKAYDTVKIVDSLGAIAYTKILVGSPLLLLCDIIQNQLGLPDGRVYLWDQKIMQPTDSGLYVAISIISSKPFSNRNVFDGSGSNNNSTQFVNAMDTLDIDIISRGPDARDRKEEVIMALESNYARFQQDANSFYIGKMPPNARFLNLSQIDGAAIPYRFKITINMQYSVTKITPVDYFSDFLTPEVTTNP